MNVEELIEALDLTRGSNYSCKKCLGDDWCKNFGYCSTCRGRLLELLKAAHEQEVASLEYEKSYYKEKTEAYERDYDDVKRRITDLAHERDGLRNRLAELSDAGITELHRLLREALGESKNVTNTARHYAERERKARGVNKEREAVIERLRKLQEVIFLHDIGCAVLGYEPSFPWSNENRAALRDKLIELIGEGGAE
jgi:hypothetical protein